MIQSPSAFGYLTTAPFQPRTLGCSHITLPVYLQYPTRAMLVHPSILLQTLTNPTRLNSSLISSSEDFYDTNPPPAATATHQEWQPERTHFHFMLPQCKAHSLEGCWECGVSNRSTWMPTQRACFKLSEFHHNPGYGPYITQFPVTGNVAQTGEAKSHSLTNQRLNDIKRKVFSPATNQDTKLSKIKI